MRALVVDDSRAMRTLLTKILEGLGADVEQADDGLAALAALRANPAPDVALVDWNMPNMDGLELVKALRKDPVRPKALMMVTSESQHDQMVRALLAGADEYLIKPFTADAVTEKLALLGVALPDRPLAAATSEG
jgi:two-component system chemotaxis response regulator CheY